MIEKFKEAPCLKNSGIIYSDSYKSAKELYELDPLRGGELAMTILELVMTGDFSSDDPMFKIILNPLITATAKSDENYKKKVAEGKYKDIEENMLDKIAEYYNQGLTQQQISIKLNGTITQQTVGNRIRKIKEKYPEMLNEELHQKNTSKKKLVKSEKPCIQENEVSTGNFNF